LKVAFPLVAFANFIRIKFLAPAFSFSPAALLPEADESTCEFRLNLASRSGAGDRESTSRRRVPAALSG
jgi:hypothetical protein